MTFSIVAWDPDARPREWGVAVASKFLAVEGVGRGGRPGAEPFGPRGFGILEKGQGGLARRRPAVPAKAGSTALRVPTRRGKLGRPGLSMGGAALRTSPGPSVST